jgi:MFS family permease
MRGALVGQLFLGLPVALFLIGLPAAKIAERAGRRKTIKLGLVFVIASLGAMIVVQEILRDQVLDGQEPNIWGLAFCIAMMGVGWALININSITIVWQLAPKEKIGSYTGLYYLFSQLAAILSPIAMGAILMVGELLVGPVFTWRSLVPFMFGSMVVALILMSRVKRGEVALTAEEIEALERQYGGGD